MKGLLIVLTYFLLQGCATVFDTPVPKYKPAAWSCSWQDLGKVQKFVETCKGKKYSDSTCFDYGVVRYCGASDDPSHKLKLIREDI